MKIGKKKLFPWIEGALQKKIISSKRPPIRKKIPLSRKDWILETTSKGKTEKWYVRCDRDHSFRFTMRNDLIREAKILEILHKSGVPVPKVVAQSKNYRAVVMEYIEGNSDFSSLTDPAQRDSVARHFAQIMAQWHNLPAKKFTSIGLSIPATPAQYLTNDLEPLEQSHYAQIREPIPLTTFVCRWLRRNIPPPPTQPVLVQGDTGPGQFLHREGRVQAVLDWEMAVLGDPMWDLANIRRRDALFPTGNLPLWFQHYSQHAGIPLDLNKIRYYSVNCAFLFTLTLGKVIQNLLPQDEHIDLIAMNVYSKRSTLEALAEAAGMAIPSKPPEPEMAQQTGYFSEMLEILESNLSREQLPNIEDKLLKHRMNMTVRLVMHLRAAAELGPDFAVMELNDMKDLLGKRPRNRQEGLAALDKLVRNSGADGDAQLVNYFWRQAMREQMLLGDAMGPLRGAKMAALV